MKWLDQCEKMGLHPYLLDYPKDEEQIFILIGEYNNALYWDKNLVPDLEGDTLRHKHSPAEYKQAVKKLDDVIKYLVEFAPQEKDTIFTLAAINLPEPTRLPTARNFKKDQREIVYARLKKAGFTNINKIINDINIAVKNPIKSS